MTNLALKVHQPRPPVPDMLGRLKLAKTAHVQKFVFTTLPDAHEIRMTAWDNGVADYSA